MQLMSVIINSNNVGIGLKRKSNPMSVKIISHLRSCVEFVLLSAKYDFEDGNIKRPYMTNQAGAILVHHE